MKKNLLEWSVFAIGVLAILAVVAGLIVDASATSGPPDLRVTAAGSEKVGERWLVRVRVRNVGGQAAEGVTVRSEAGEQQAEFDIDYVPQGSEREGFLIFRDEPRGLEVNVSGTGSP